MSLDASFALEVESLDPVTFLHASTFQPLPKPPHHDRRATVSYRYRGLETIRPYKIPRHSL